MVKYWERSKNWGCSVILQWCLCCLCPQGLPDLATTKKVPCRSFYEMKSFFPKLCFTSSTRWFCEGRELHNSPDIQIWRDGDLHTLVITEAFEDDTGRYTCVASNSLGADNTSAEVYIEGLMFSYQEIIIPLLYCFWGFCSYREVKS